VTSERASPRHVAPGAPGQNGNVGARGAPYKVPPYGARGFPKEDALAELTTRFTVACGGTLCVTFKYDERIETMNRCSFYDTDPVAGAPFHKGQTILIVVGTQPCDPVETAEPSETSEPLDTDEPVASETPDVSPS
jgi:hypothetical protein